EQQLIIAVPLLEHSASRQPVVAQRRQLGTRFSEPDGDRKGDFLAHAQRGRRRLRRRWRVRPLRIVGGGNVQTNAWSAANNQRDAASCKQQEKQPDSHRMDLRLGAIRTGWLRKNVVQV